MSESKPKLTIYLAQPRGFCAGVERAIQIVEAALNKYGSPIYVRHEIVHNKWVVDDLRSRGVVFVKEVSDVPDGGVTIFSAHGVAEEVIAQAQDRQLPHFDATCPLVTKVHNQVKRYDREDYAIILIGHAGHPEVEGTLGQVDKPIYLVGDVQEAKSLQLQPYKKLSYVTQTTLSVDDTKDIILALKERFPDLEGPAADDICYATQNRQEAVKDLADLCDVVLVVGASNSSNSMRLKDLAEQFGKKAYRIDTADDLEKKWFSAGQVIGLTAGASAPEHLVQGVIEWLEEGFDVKVRLQKGEPETITFNLPKELREYA